VLYAYLLGNVGAQSFDIVLAFGFVAFAYVGGITMVSGAIVGGLIASDGLVSHFLQAQLGISGTWTLLVAGLVLILSLITFPDGIAGSAYQKRKRMLADKRRQELAAERRPAPPAKLASTVVGKGET
jgi:branched-chain amino acid transport system permease protein